MCFYYIALFVLYQTALHRIKFEGLKSLFFFLSCSIGYSNESKRYGLDGNKETVEVKLTFETNSFKR